jgi:hypothetical protein
LESGQENYSWERKNNELNNSKIDLGNNQQDFFKQINPNPQSSQGLVNDFILFEDDFSTSLGDDWEFGGDGSSGWSVVEGRGQVDLNVPETASRILAGDFDWRNYQVDFDLLFYRGVDRHFIFGYQDVDNYYRLVFLGKFLSWQPALRLEKIQGGENYLLLNEEYPLDYLFNDQQEHDLTLGVNDNLIQVYLDNEKMMEYVLTDTDFLPQGKIGFGVWTGDSASEKFSFDNLKVKTFFNGLSLTDTIDLPFVESFNSAQFDSWRQTGPYNCPLTLWQGTCPENAWQVVDNQAQIDLNGRNLYSRLLTGDPSWENYQLDVDLRLKKGVTRYILLRYQSQENYYQISLQGFWRYDFSTPAIYLDKFVANEKTELARYFFPGKIYFNQDQEYHLTAIVDENHLKIYLDGEKLIDYIDDDSPLTYGKIGFGVWSGHSEEGDMNFDNLRVQQVSNFPNLPLISQPMVSEDFSEGQADSWEEVGPLVWEVRDGQYGMSVVGQRNLRAQTFIGNYSWQDYVIEFDVNLGLGVERYVRFRYADQENYYQLSFMGKWRDAWLPHLRLYRFSTHDGDQVLSEVNVLPYTFNYSEFHHVKIVVQGESIKVYLNDSAEPILDVLDEGTRLTRGKFGLGVWTGDDKNAIVCWDNITINPLD